jgi:hypothetical protein
MGNDRLDFSHHSKQQRDPHTRQRAGVFCRDEWSGTQLPHDQHIDGVRRDKRGGLMPAFVEAWMSGGGKRCNECDVVHGLSVEDGATKKREVDSREAVQER